MRSDTLLWMSMVFTTCILLFLKLTGIANISWLIVIAPIGLPLLCALALIAAFSFLAALSLMLPDDNE